MNWIDRIVIASVSPQWALRRAQARRALALYEAAEPSRLRRERKDRRSANAQNLRSVESLRNQARHLEQNLDIASGALDVLVNNVVGTGIQPEPMVKTAGGELAQEVNDALLKLWDDWIYAPEVTAQHDYYTLQRLMARTWLRDGEVFGQKLIGVIPLLDHRTVLPYSIEALEPDFVPLDLNDPAKGLVQGIEHNAWGAPRRYYVALQHPGGDSTSAVQTKLVAADRIVHLKLAKRLHQVRGVSQFASVITRLDDIKEIDESERVAARVAAAMSAYVKKGTPDLYDDADHPVGTDGQRQLRAMEMVPGMIFDDLAPGEDIGTIASNRPNNALIPFRDAQLRSAAAGLGASFSSLSKNYNGTYSAQRQELVEQYGNYRAITSQFVFRFCQPIWDGFIDAVIATGAVSLAGIDRATVYDVSHAAPPMPWIDPLKEVEANAMMEDRGYKSRSRIIRERGDNPAQVNQEILRDQAEAERLGLELGGPEKAAADQAADAAEADREAADERAMREREAADARTAQLVKAVLEQAPPVVNVATGAVTVEPAQVHNHVAPAAVSVTTPEPVVNVHVPEPVVNLEATIQSPSVHVAAPAVTVENHLPARGPQVIEATKRADGSLRAEIRDVPKH